MIFRISHNLFHWQHEMGSRLVSRRCHRRQGRRHREGLAS